MLSCQQSVVRLLVVDDHALTRFSLKSAFSMQNNIELVGLACNGKEAIEMVERERPNVIIMDMQMPVMDGVSASAHIKSIEPHTQIIAFSSLEDPRREFVSHNVEVDAVCAKDAATTDLINLVQELGLQKAKH
ncbi:MAG: response regulator transcription factor [Symploca sp. SIO3C6]|uniref:Response regulator transcription factor n=1 Tax=Symploca sp. SIO1C4 TaxID=2607765 RepID=A0A6B3NDN8_9CYAN|nr:response regulator transcription factor [Symploca sp. SIO3C6]NER31229.1 response regulator transcription factor [Symploca sp. SIO1C4]NET03584.1 response regulator transcription factor [Symploca sp. SIO2B6]